MLNFKIFHIKINLYIIQPFCALKENENNDDDFTKIIRKKAIVDIHIMYFNNRSKSQPSSIHMYICS